MTAHPTDPAIDYHAMWWKAERDREKAETERDEWRQTALDERAAALDALEQIKVRDARIKSVRKMHAPSEFGCQQECREDHGDIQWPCPTTRALDGDA